MSLEEMRFNLALKMATDDRPIEDIVIRLEKLYSFIVDGPCEELHQTHQEPFPGDNDQ